MDTLLQVPPAAIDDDDERTNFALLQVCPDEALPIPGEPGEGVDVIAISASRERLEQFAADYQQRFQAATEEFDTWDKLVGRGSEWSEALDRKLFELLVRYRVDGALVSGACWRIVEVCDRADVGL